MSWFEDKHALITGGKGGIGAAIARVIGDKGARVTLLGRDATGLEETAAELGADWQVADVTDRDQVEAAFAAAADASGAIDILVNNAGIAEAVPFRKLTGERWDSMLAVNLTGTFNCTRAVIQSMLDRDFGRIVNIASIAGLSGYPYVAAYCAAKHGVVGLTRALAREYAGHDITVNAVCPGYTDTDMVHRAIDKIVEKTGRTREQALAEIVRTNPQGRLIRPEEVADTVAWLCRQPSMTGQAIAIAGGEIL